MKVHRAIACASSERGVADCSAGKLAVKMNLQIGKHRGTARVVRLSRSPPSRGIQVLLTGFASPRGYGDLAELACTDRRQLAYDSASNRTRIVDPNLCLCQMLLRIKKSLKLGKLSRPSRRWSTFGGPYGRRTDSRNAFRTGDTAEAQVRHQSGAISRSSASEMP